MKTFVWSQLAEEARTELLRRPSLREDAALRARVAEIVAHVRDRGDRALLGYAAELDGVEIDALRVTERELDAAEATLGPEEKAAIAVAAANIERFHAAQLSSPIRVETAPGVVCERVTRPIANVGLYVPAGSAPLPSTALMLAIPAGLAGCRSVLCSPPQKDGAINAAVLYVAKRCGIADVFKIGGAQAIAAMAYGTESVPQVAKVFGPGNSWVTAAKALVAQDPMGAARDMPAGPSEVLVIADRGADPEFVAADLLSQAEHGPDSQAVLLTTSRELATAVLDAITAQQATLSRRDIVAASLAHSFAVVVEDLATALEVSNRYAPEHLILQVDDPRRWIDRVQAAGSVFLGPWAPESVGDYCSGTNHVLPTYGFARAYSSLGVGDFLRSMTVQELSAAGIAAIGPTARTLATMEGLDAHAVAVDVRLRKARGVQQ